MSYQIDFSSIFEGKGSSIAYNTVFDHILENMSADNGCTFKAYDDDYEDAEQPIYDLMDSGYFVNSDPDDLDGCYWMMAAGEESEAEEYFERNYTAYCQLQVVLTRIFEEGVSA